MAENRVRKAAVMLNSGLGEVGRAAEGAAPPGPGGTCEQQYSVPPHSKTAGI